MKFNAVCFVNYSPFDLLRCLFKNVVALGYLLVLTLFSGVHGFGQNILNDNDFGASKLHDNVKTGALITKDTAVTKASEKGKLVPIPIIVTEPALGNFGGGLTLAYMHSNRKSKNKNTPATISGIAGGYTKNKSWAFGLAHSQSISNDKLRYTGVIAHANVNMSFYEKIASADFKFDVNLDVWTTYHKFLFRMNDSKLFIGPEYLYLNTSNGLELNSDHPRLDSLLSTIRDKSKLGMLGINLVYDGRDNTLSPNKGMYLTVKGSYNSPIFGGERYDILGVEIEENFLLAHLEATYYFQASDRLFGGIRFDSQLVDGNFIPFYAKPYIALRGVPSMRYQGERVMVAETQWRAVVYRSLSLLGFVGTGKAMDKLSDFGDADWIYNYGAGFRFGMKNVFDLRMGLDFAWSNDDFAWYISVGSSF